MFNIDEIPKDKSYNEKIEANVSVWRTNNVHDPALFRDGDWYYVFSTDAQVGGTFKPGFQICKSKELMNWRWFRRAFDDVPYTDREWPGAYGLWYVVVVM